MKKYIPLLSLLLFAHLGFAQCIVDAGPPIHFCESNVGTGQEIKATVIEGKPPYSVTWSYTYSSWPGKIPSTTASDIIDDTTILNPSIITTFRDISLIRIDVKDSMGDSCFDFLEVTYSEFISTAETTPKFIKEGDSINLCAPFHVYGGFEPYQDFIWKYESGSVIGSDTNSCLQTTPFYRKDCSYIGNGYTGKSFSVTASDMYGCIWKDWIDVAFLPTGIVEQTNQPKGAIQYSQQTLFIAGLQSSESITIGVFNLQGKRLDTFSIGQSRELYLGNKGYNIGVYVVVVESDAGTQLRKKVLIGQD